MTYRVVLTDAHQHTLDKTLLGLMRDCDAEFEARVCETEQQVIDLCADADVVMTSHAQITPKAIQAMRKCRLIARIGTGYDNVDDAAAGVAGIPVTNVPGFCTEEVAVHTVALLLASVRKVAALDRGVRSGVWDPNSILPVRRLSEQTLGLIGFGAIGRAVATRMAPFGMTIVYYDPFYQPVPDAPAVTACEDMESLLKSADIVSLHLPLTPVTRGTIGMSQFKCMKRDAVLINTARGGLIVEEDLVRALQEGVIAGAGLDVLVREPPPPDHPLYALENVVLTPHSSGHSIESMTELRRRVVEEVVRALRGEPLRHVVNGESLEESVRQGLSSTWVRAGRR